jgi:drug/metabolite transporter (DMT)-like permease
MGRTKSGYVYLGLAAGSLFWGTSFAAAKIGLRELSPLNLVIFRFSLASALFAVILGCGRDRPRLRRGDVPRFLVLGFFAISSYFYFQFLALRYTTTIISSLIIATSPIFTALISHAIGRERIRALAAAGIAAAFTGVLLIITNGRWSGLVQSNSWKGDALLLLNALVWSGFTVYGQTLMQAYRPFVAIAYVQMAGTLLLLPLAFFATPLAPQPLCLQIRHLSWPTCLAGLYLAAPCSVFAYHVWYKGVEALGPVRTSVFTYLNPLFAIATGIFLLHEPLTLFTVAGGALVILGVYSTNVTRQKTLAATRQGRSIEKGEPFRPAEPGR